jgi:hypothetical protein
MARSSKRQVEQAQATIADQLQGISDEYLECRDPGFGHDWKKTRGFHAIPVKQVRRGSRVANLARVETCARCTAVKTERFVINAYDQIEKVSQSTDYPDGYLMSGTGVPRGVKRSTLVWTENYRRAMEEVAEAAEGSKRRSSKSVSKVTPIRSRRKAG